MHGFANPTRFLKLARPLTPVCLILGLILLSIGLYSGLFLTPPDYLQKESVRILYVHVPAAWLGMGGWTGIAVANAMQLIWKHPLSGVAARAIALPGAVFCFTCLVTGSIWGRPTWGTWWEWDGRMTSMLVLQFLYFGYIALANAEDERGSVSTATAIFGIVGAINIPIINRSVVWWNSLHQESSISVGKMAIASEIAWPLWYSLAGFSFLFAAIVLMRMRTQLAIIKKEARMRRMAAS
jgi:heme exporter protein C